MFWIFIYSPPLFFNLSYIYAFTLLEKKDIFIEAGSMDGQRYRVEGEGDEEPDSQINIFKSETDECEVIFRYVKICICMQICMHLCVVISEWFFFVKVACLLCSLFFLCLLICL
jgi:hypothetical protein